MKKISMPQATVKAIRESIAHWERMRDVRNTGEGPGSTNCPLCTRFHNWEDRCERNAERCPIRRKTGRIECKKTPWGSAFNAWKDRKDDKDTWNAWVKAADRMIRFLKSLLPKGGKK